ncbi:MAG: GTP 3',8-cyclase MoaA [Planctomycetota bacterium]|jgi:cyclic pyranopterin phosphate synthase|nr:GTP 3',8-cyclase MoaA [Planctomycetota bacterium]
MLVQIKGQDLSEPLAFDAPLPDQMVDNLGRVINSLRISVTDRCNFRCTYCMPEEVDFMQRNLLLSYEEIARFVRLVVPLGINKLRITGGEPLMRKYLPNLIRQLNAIDGINDIAMTTNGFLLKEHAQALKDAGLHRVNVSLDTLVREKFVEITRRDALQIVLDGIHAADRAGFSPIKINAVAIRGFTEDEIPAFAELTRNYGHQVRFIEFMPLDADDTWENQKVLPGREIIERINAAYPLEAINNSHKEPATLYRFKDGVGGDIGIIPSVTEPFCDHCNRIRITSDGKLRTCLFSNRETDIRSLLRGDAGDEMIARRVVEAVRNKEPGHKINQPDFVKPQRAMFSIGG